MAARGGGDSAKGSVGPRGGLPATGPADDGEDVAEVDPTGRFHRYRQQVGMGRFKKVYRGYDTEEGVEVAWCKVFDFEKGAVPEILEELRRGIALNHPNIIRSHACWECERTACVNLVAELLEGRSLRDYRQRYRHLEQTELKELGRQILCGLACLHGQCPPAAHGDLSCDKVYLDGSNGDLKIGALGLGPLLAKRYGNSTVPAADLKTPAEDMYCFGLVLLELHTKVYVDRSVPFAECLRQLGKAKDEQARDVIATLLGDADQRPSSAQLLQSDHFGTPHVGQPAGAASKRPKAKAKPPVDARALRGEDYSFVVAADDEPAGGRVHFEIRMTKEADPGTVQNVGFDYVLGEDSPEQVAEEMASSFGLSVTDKEICASALREWLASKDLPCGGGYGR